jgi:DNA-binding NarL/FixJ family response regulator
LEKDSFQYILLDISMPDMSGLELLKTIKEKNIDSKVIMLTMHHDFSNANTAIDYGADGYILKDNGITEIKDAIQSIDKGLKFISKEISQMLSGVSKMNTESSVQVAGLKALTERELEVAKLIAEGKSSQQIASQLFLSPTTVTTHRRNVFHKLDISKTASLIKMIYESGMMAK